MNSGQERDPDGASRSDGEQYGNTRGPNRVVTNREQNPPNLALRSLGEDQSEPTNVDMRAGEVSSDSLQDPEHASGEDNPDVDNYSDIDSTSETQWSEEEEEEIQELMRRSASLFALFERSGALEVINQAIACCESVISLLPESHEEKPSMLSNLGCAYLSRFEFLNTVEDLNKAINCGVQAAVLTDDNDEDKASILVNLGNSYRTRFQCLGELVDLSKAIDYGAQAVSNIPDGRLDKLGGLCNLGNSYLVRFLRLGELADLNEAIDCGTRALSLTPDGHPARPSILNDLGSSHQVRFDNSGELGDLDKAIGYREQAVLLVPNQHAAKPAMLDNLGSSYRTRHERLGGLVDLDKAIDYGLKAASLTPDSRSNKPGILNGLGNSYQTRFKRKGDLSDINNAIKYGARAVALAPDSQTAKPRLLSNLGNSYRIRFERLGEQADLNRAIDYGTRAVDLTPGGHADEPSQLSHLGISYLVRFKHSGELRDLDKAMDYGARAVSLTPDGRADNPNMLNNLGNSYQSRFQRLGELQDLTKAIHYKTQAVSLIPDSHVNKPGQLSNLANSYLTLFERLGELGNLNKSVQYGTQAVLLTPDTHTDKPRVLNNLGNAYQIRFERLGEPLDLDKAIDCGVRAISLASDSYADRPRILNNLGNSYRTRFERLGETVDSDKAIEHATQANSLTADSHMNKPGQLNNLASAYLVRFERLGDLEDLNKAIEYGSRAALLTPGGHIHKPGHLTNLANAYVARYGVLNELSDYESAITCFKDAALSSGGSPFFRFRACQEWARLVSLQNASSPHDAYLEAFKLLPQLIWIGTTLHRRYSLVANLSSFATEAASYAISIQDYGLALEWLEAGRSIVWTQMTQFRTPYESLFSQNPGLASRLEEVGRKLESAGSRLLFIELHEDDNEELDQETSEQVELALSWDSLLSEARSIPGLKDFLRPYTSSQLLDAVKSHPIVVINAHASRCDALILQPDNKTISHVPLTDFSMGKALATRRNLISLGRDRKPGRLDKFGLPEKSLEELWIGVVKPCLEFLGYTQKLPILELPRITWCTTGPLSFLPLHAAGPYDDSQANVFDLVISSYTPTLSNLFAKQSVSTNDFHGLLAVGQEHTPGLNPLPGTKAELAVIKIHAQVGEYIQLENEEATIAQVLDAMNRSSWVHLACHGSQESTDPTRSAFHLHDGGLTLATLIKNSFQNKGLAFLSACQTATGDQNMTEEAMHLAAGMLMAGFPSVIGTMWSIEDEDGPVVADKVYAELFRGGETDYTKVARALHQAVAHLRTKVGEKAIARWAPFLHMGA